MKPTFLVQLAQRLRAAGKSNRQIFDDIYSHKRWHGDGEISSGLGSIPDNTTEYEDFVSSYILKNDIRAIVDVGCGDFQVSQRLLSRLNDINIIYKGLDVSEVVINHNNKHYCGDNISFCLHDASHDRVPPGDLVMIREVLQHLPNADVANILDNVEHCPHVLITNSQPLRPSRINHDIAAGSNSRAGFGSGLQLDQAPFFRQVERVLAVPHKRNPTVIETVRLIGSKDASAGN